jgi:glutamate-1-semialdehyde 2,1-aminomutase
VKPYDVELFDRHLRTWTPPGSFDAHVHLYATAELGDPTPLSAAAGPACVDLRCFRDTLGAWMGDRAPQDGLFFAYPYPQIDVAACNGFIARQAAASAGSRALMLIRPGDDPADVERQVAKHGFCGFKVYHVYARGGSDTFLAPTDAFLPDWVWRIAHERGLVIMLHMVRPKALADPLNQKYIRQHCLDYPNARLVLAHAARGFCGRHTVEGIESLRGLDNVFFDTSGVCESSAFQAILDTFGPSRLFFALDFPVTQTRARCVNLADGFLWLNEVSPDYSRSKFAKPTLLGIESMLALKEACRTCRLSDHDVEDLFCRNARQLLGIAATRPRPDVQAAYRHALDLIPGGTQLFSKRPELFAPGQWPAYYSHASGCEIIDIQGRRFLDFSGGGILSTILGYADPDVNAAVIRRAMAGSMSTLQTYDEVELAELLVQIHPWAHMARFTRTGGEAVTAAVRIARAASGRDKVVICGYHGWHDWYLAANVPPPGADSGEGAALRDHLLPGLLSAGVPRALGGSALTFHYNRLDELDAVLAEHGDQIGALVMETTRHQDPQPGFLEGVRERCTQRGIPLVFDEVSIGWRLCLGGAHRLFGVEPDVAVFAKALANGYPMGAIIGRRHVMEAAARSFISSAFWSEGIGPAAALAAVRKMQRIDVPAHLRQVGQRVIEGWRHLADQHKLAVAVGGRPQMVIFSFQHPRPDALMTLFTVQMLQQGFLAGGYFNPMYAHQPQHVDKYLAALDRTFAVLAAAVAADDIEARIGGPVKMSFFRRLT